MKKKLLKDKQDHCVTVRWTQKEKKMLERLAKRYSLSIAEIVRIATQSYYLWGS
jgi:replication initiation and membrane attachment protein DnaB